MRWCLYIPSIIFLLTFGVELCASSPGSAAVKDPSRLACVLDGDDAELKLGALREFAFTECDEGSLAWHSLMNGWLKESLILPLREAEVWKIHMGIRRHRWLCRERC